MHINLIIIKSGTLVSISNEWNRVEQILVPEKRVRPQTHPTTVTCELVKANL